MKKKIYVLMVPILLLATLVTKAQTKIGDNKATINSNSLLELESTTKALLQNRLALTATNNPAPLSAHIAGMRCYNTATSGTGATQVTPGEYFNDGTQWVRLQNTAPSCIQYGSGAPTGACTGGCLYSDTLSGSPTLGQQWTCSGGSWVSYTQPAATEWNLYGTSNDAGANKLSWIHRGGGVLIDYATGNWSNPFGFSTNSSIKSYFQQTPNNTTYFNNLSGQPFFSLATMYTGGAFAVNDQHTSGSSFSNPLGFAVINVPGTNSPNTVSYKAYMQINPSDQLIFINNYGGGFSFGGNVAVGGTLSKSAGTFKIDHPQDPANKYLIHSFVESPDMMNVYNGNITTDANGYATVKLPSYFQAENKDFRYQLTAIDNSDDFVQVKVVEKIANNQFRVRTSKGNVEVSWQVTGIRNDEYAKAHRIVDEVEKTGAEKGKYISPELFNQPKEKGIYYAPEIKQPTVTPNNN